MGKTRASYATDLFYSWQCRGSSEPCQEWLLSTGMTHHLHLKSKYVQFVERNIWSLLKNVLHMTKNKHWAHSKAQWQNNSLQAGVHLGCQFDFQNHPTCPRVSSKALLFGISSSTTVTSLVNGHQVSIRSQPMQICAQDAKQKAWKGHIQVCNPRPVPPLTCRAGTLPLEYKNSMYIGL